MSLVDPRLCNLKEARWSLAQLRIGLEDFDFSKVFTIKSRLRETLTAGRQVYICSLLLRRAMTYGTLLRIRVTSKRTEVRCYYILRSYGTLVALPIIDLTIGAGLPAVALAKVGSTLP